MTGSTRRQRDDLSRKGDGISFATLLMKSSKAAEASSSDALTALDVTSEVGITLVDGGTPTDDTSTTDTSTDGGTST
jgi:hypothetical protein